MNALNAGNFEMNTNTQCLCCRAIPSAFEIRYILPEFDGMIHHVLECKDCSFRFMSPMPEDGWLENHYRHRDLFGADSTFPEDYKNSILDKIELFNEFVTPNFSYVNIPDLLAVDFGAGSGYVVKSFETIGFKSFGLELNPHAPERGLELFGVNLQNCGLEALEDNSVSVFSMFEVLEHLKDPVLFLNSARSKINKNGLLIGTVPNYYGLGRIFFGVKSIALAQPEHVIYFDSKSLNQVLLLAGFTPIFIGAKKPVHVVIDLGLRKEIFKLFGRNIISRNLVSLITCVKKYIIYPFANFFVERTGKLAHGLTFVAKIN